MPMPTGAAYYFDHEGQNTAGQAEGNYILYDAKGGIPYWWIVNSAGLGCSNISDMLGNPRL